MLDNDSRPYVTFFDGTRKVTCYQDKTSHDAKEDGPSWLTHGLVEATRMMYGETATIWLLGRLISMIEIDIDFAEPISDTEDERRQKLLAALREFLE